MRNRSVNVLLSESQRKHLFLYSGLQLFADGGDGTGDGDDPGEEKVMMTKISHHSTGSSGRKETRKSLTDVCRRPSTRQSAPPGRNGSP